MFRRPLWRPCRSIARPQRPDVPSRSLTPLLPGECMLLECIRLPRRAMCVLQRPVTPAPSALARTYSHVICQSSPSSSPFVASTTPPATRRCAAASGATLSLTTWCIGQRLASPSTYLRLARAAACGAARRYPMLPSVEARHGLSSHTLCSATRISPKRSRSMRMTHT